MGIAIPQVITSDRASGAQVIDGSLKFNTALNFYLTRTPGSASNRKTWTWSAWINKSSNGIYQPVFFGNQESSNNTGTGLRFENTDKIDFYQYSSSSFTYRLLSTRLLKNVRGWYHLVIAFDTTQSTESDRIKIYVNGEQVTSWGSATYPSQNTDWYVNNNTAQYIGAYNFSDSVLGEKFDGGMSQVYLIDGQALTPDSFGFTDGLTNTWKPKKYEGTFGTNGFYLPMDGNSPIGQDQSGQGNDWTPVNFGGSVALDSLAVSGAKPILNTTQGGTVAGVGVFGSKQNVGYAVTVGPKTGGGNAYYIDGVERPTLTGLIRGATYTFDTSDSTVSSTHPFRLSATSAHGTEYTNGVAAITGAATTITIPYDAPESLYYYCTAHSGMGSSITGITTNEKLADQYASNCTLALPLVGDDDDICASIACTAHNKTATNNSVNPSNAVDNLHSNFYNGSHHWSANSDTLQYAEQGDELVFGTSDYTIECWLYDDNGHNGTSNRCYIFDNRIGGSVVGDPPTMTGYIDSHNEFNFGDGTNTITHTVPSTVGKWWHYAVTREGTTTRMFIDGILRGSATSSTNFTNNGIGVGRATDANYGFAGYIQDFRVYKGIAKYTSNFVVPATSPDILPDTPSGVSGGSKLTKITDGSVAFDGTNDSLSIADHADFTFGSGDFTLEAYAYLDYATGYRSLAQKYGGSPSTSSWFWSFNDGQQVFYYYSGGNEPNMTSPIKQYNRWVHCAVAREGNTIRMFDDGKLTGTLDVSSYTSMNDSTVPVDIGADYADNYDFNGFISNVRIVKGTALYTKNFTPPTAPLTNVTNTKLLCCQSPTSATEAAVSPSTPSVVNNAVPTTFNPFNTDINTVRGQETGYATWNPLSVRDNVTFSDGNLTLTNSGSGASGWRNVACTQSVTSGKWYVEMHTIGSQNGGLMPGVCKLPDDSGTFNPATFSNNFPGMTANSYSLNCFSGSKRTNGSDSGYGSAMAAGDLIMMCLDMDNGAIWWGKNGIWFASGNPATNSNAAFTGLTGEFVFACGISASEKIVTNFGQKPFKFAPPDGFQPLTTTNTRPVKVISRPDQYVGIVTYTGTGNPLVVRDLNMKPNLIWIKNRGAAQKHTIVDSVRTTATGEYLSSSDDAAQGTGVHISGVENGISIADPNSSTIWYNDSSYDYVAWTWKAGGNKNTFNIDDVGYASASAAGMAAGDFNSTAYNTSQRWSDNLTVNTGSVSNATQAFNGNLTNGADSSASTGSNDRTMTVTLGLTLNNETVEVYPNHTYSGYYATIDGVAQSTQYQVTDYGFAVMGPFTGTLTSVTVTNGTESSNRPAGIRAVKVAGKILIDDNITPPNIPNIAPTGASVGTKQGFAIVKYTGNSSNQSTVPHKLLEAPKFVIVKNLTRTSQNWIIGHANAGEKNDNPGFTGFRQGNQLYFTNAAVDGGTSQFFSGAHPEANYFTVKDNYEVNYLNDDYVAYLWHDVPGLQKFGKFIGNADADGPYVELGFKPAVVWIKNSTDGGSSDNWACFDNVREGYNVDNDPLYLNKVNAEATTDMIDLLSNGFKIRGTYSSINGSADNMIYCAWAAAPSVDLFGGGANAR